MDHNHRTGQLRAVLCRNCNGIEGKIQNLANRVKSYIPPTEFVNNLVLYWRMFATAPPDAIFHPSHRTDDEKRLERNRKARVKRAKIKGK